MQLYPAILTDSLTILQQKLALVKQTELTVVQIDVIDGSYVDNLTVDPLDLAVVDFGDLKLDFHLMVDEPMDYVWEVESVSQSLPIRSIIAQLEHMSFQEDFLLEVKQQQWRAGLSLDLDTPLEAIDADVWQLLDVLQLMGIRAGYQGQFFEPVVLTKIKAAKELLTKVGSRAEIMVDGGVKLANATQIKQAGADSVAVGSALWQARDLNSIIEQFKQI